MKMIHRHEIQLFNLTKQRALETTIEPTIASPGVFVHMDSQSMKGKIEIFFYEQNCDCTHPSQCQHKSELVDNIPCKQAGASRISLSTFNFHNASSADELIGSMKHLVGIDLEQLPIGQRAALECLKEMQWGFTQADIDKFQDNS